MNFVTLKAGKEKAIQNHHHWIFSGAIAHLPEFSDGDILTVKDKKGNALGSAYFNKRAKIIGRMVSFENEAPLETIQQNIQKAILWRKTLFDKSKTTAFRLINAEGDSLPGLIADLYRNVLTIQISTLGMEKLKPFILNCLKEELKKNGYTLSSIYEKSNLPARKEEGLQNYEALLEGEALKEVEILENGNKFLVSIPDGQKTGFFLDHREMRQKIAELSVGKRILNCFSYSGGFSIYAVKAGASQTDSVDISEKAVEMAKKNAALNNLDVNKMNFLTADVFEFLRHSDLNYDLVILDPPAFAKKQKDIIPACRGYKDINRIAMQKMPKGSILLTCSCSYHVDEKLFQQVLFQAAREACRSVKIIGRQIQAKDHPINIFHPESDYLKSFLLYLD
ncbi:MAG TPA: class I SAM-dependent rRNA methyltransferase [Parachlamydiaceae bacterium]|nr:class I SAM-dependent rRNA methyltransferase [Parachlamydiaceae bacterium]